MTREYKSGRLSLQHAAHFSHVEPVFEKCDIRTLYSSLKLYVTVDVCTCHIGIEYNRPTLLEAYSQHEAIMHTEISKN
jgi:hypothetical protein